MDRIGPTAVLHKYQGNLSGFYPKHTFQSHLKNKKTGSVNFICMKTIQIIFKQKNNYSTIFPTYIETPLV